MGRPRRGRRQDRPTASRDSREGRRSLRQPRHPVRAGQGRHVQRLRVGQLLPRRRHRRRQPAGRPPRASSPMPPSWCGPIRRSTRRSSSPTAPSACRSMPARIISRCTCWRASCRAIRSRSCRAPNGSRNRFNLMMKGEIEATTLTEPYITLAEKKGCRTICSAFYPRHRGRLRQGRRRNLRRLQPRGARGGATHQCRQGGLSPLLHRLSQGEGPGDRHAQGRTTCAPAASWSPIRRRSRRMNCSAPTNG